MQHLPCVVVPLPSCSVTCCFVSSDGNAGPTSSCCVCIHGSFEPCLTQVVLGFCSCWSKASALLMHQAWGAGMAVVLTAALAQPQQARARLPAAAASSTSDGSSEAPSQPLKPQPEYWDLVRKFEPWVLDDPDLPEEIRRPPATGRDSEQHPFAHHFRPDAPIISFSD